MSLLLYSFIHLFTVQTQVLKALKQGLLLNLSECVLGNLTENSRPQQTEALSSMIKLSANTDDIRKLINNLLSSLENVESFERYLLSLKMEQILIVTSCYNTFFPFSGGH